MDIEDIKFGIDNVYTPPFENGIRTSYLFKNLKKAPLIFMQKYQGKPEFEEHFYKIN